MAWIEGNGAAEHLELDTSQRDNLGDAMWLGKKVVKFLAKIVERWENHEEMNGHDVEMMG